MTTVGRHSGCDQSTVVVNTVSSESLHIATQEMKY